MHPLQRRCRCCRHPPHRPGHCPPFHEAAMRVGRLLLHVRRRGVRADRPNWRAHVHVGGRGMMQEHPMGWIPRSPVSPNRCSSVAYPFSFCLSIYRRWRHIGHHMGKGGAASPLYCSSWPPPTPSFSQAGDGDVFAAGSQQPGAAAQACSAPD